VNIRTFTAVVLVVLGVLGLVYRGFNYTTEKHQAKIGPLELAVKEKERVEVPVWLGVVLIGAGAALLVAGRK
jgi:hypothetical protein